MAEMAPGADSGGGDNGRGGGAVVMEGALTLPVMAKKAVPELKVTVAAVATAVPVTLAVVITGVGAGALTVPVDE